MKAAFTKRSRSLKVEVLKGLARISFVLRQTRIKRYSRDVVESGSFAGWVSAATLCGAHFEGPCFFGALFLQKQTVFEDSF